MRIESTNLIKNDYNFLKLLWDFSFIFWLITELTITHSMIAQIALALFGAITILIIILENKIIINSIIIYYSIFIIICYLNIFLGYSINKELSKALLSTLIKDLIFIIIFYYYITIQGIAIFKKAFIFATTTTTIILLPITYFNTGSFILRGEESLVNPNSIAICAAFTVFWIIASGKKLKVFDCFIISILSLFFILSGTRKAIIALIIGLIVYICLKNPKMLIRNAIIITISLCVLYFLMIKINFLYNSIGYRIESFIALIQGNESDSSAETRQHFIELGWLYFKQNPILGFGINCFQTIPGSYGTYSHNNYIELLFSVGIIGTISYYSMHITIFIRAIKQYIKNKKNNIILALSFITITLTMDIAMVSYYSRSSLMYIVICYALIERIND